MVASPFSSDQTGGALYVEGEAKNTYAWNTYHQKIVFNHWPVGYANPIQETQLPIPSGWELTTIARTNPSRPVLTPPELLQDLIEIPKQIFETGNLFRKPKSLLSGKEVANKYLLAKFGWLPLFDDLRQLLDLQHEILKRNLELQRLYSGRGLGRRINLDKQTFSGSSVETIAGIGSESFIKLHSDYFVQKEMWATIRWYPTKPPAYAPGDMEWNSLARRLVLGLTIEGMLKGAWNVIPWTWLLGWFTNVGSYALANSNTVPASHGQACLMRKVSVFHSPGFVETPGFTESSVEIKGLRYRTLRSRTVSSSVTPGFNMPYLDMSKLSVLGALFVQRLR